MKKSKLHLMLKDKAFTLIELLVVIAIIGLLSSIVLASLASAKVRASVSKDVQSAVQLTYALELYKNDHNGSYPTSTATYPYSESLVSSTNFRNVMAPYIKLTANSYPQSGFYFSPASLVSHYGCGSSIETPVGDYIIYFTVPAGEKTNLKQFYVPVSFVADTYCLTSTSQ